MVMLMTSSNVKVNKDCIFSFIESLKLLVLVFIVLEYSGLACLAK